MMKLLLALALCLFAVTANAQQALSPSSSGAIEGSHVFCTSACKLYTASLTTGASAGFWMLFDANSVPADGLLTTAPRYCWTWAASTGAGYTWPGGAQFQSGLVAVFSTGLDCLHKTASATAFFTVQVQ